MRRACLSLAIAATLTLVGCDKVPNLGKAIAGSPQGSSTLATDDKARGEITSASPVNYSDGSRHQLYSLKLEADQAVELKLEGSLAGRISVFKENAVIAAIGGTSPTGDHEHGGTPSPQPLTLAFRAPATGTYTVAVSSTSADAYGPFTLSSRGVTPYAGGPLSVGTEAIDWLVSEQQAYTLRIDKAGLYDVTLESAAFDTVLALRGNGVEQENDDYGNGTHSRLQVQLAPGQYTATVRALDNTSRGAFKLTLGTSSLPEGTIANDGTTLPHDQQVTGLMDSSARRSFNLVVDRFSRVTLDARSSHFDTVLEVTGRGVNSEDDDGGNGTNSRLELNLEPGSYTVSVRSLGGNPGNFTLQASISDL